MPLKRPLRGWRPLPNNNNRSDQQPHNARVHGLSREPDGGSSPCNSGSGSRSPTPSGLGSGNGGAGGVRGVAGVRGIAGVGGVKGIAGAGWVRGMGEGRGVGGMGGMEVARASAHAPPPPPPQASLSRSGPPSRLGECKAKVGVTEVRCAVLT